MSCELANEWAHCSGKNASYITILNVSLHKSLHHGRLTKSNSSSTELASSYGVTNEVLFQIAALWDPLDYLPLERETENKQNKQTKDLKKDAEKTLQESIA